LLANVKLFVCPNFNGSTSYAGERIAPATGQARIAGATTLNA
jgi:hypothetical protein